MSLRPKPEIESLQVPHHGGINYAELKAMGLASESVLDFSVCSNPFMPPPGIKKALNTIAIERYPDSEATELIERLSERLGVAPDNILAGSGTTELIRLVALTYFGKGDRVLIPEPTYGEYEVASKIVEAKLIKQRMRAEDSFTPKLEETAGLIRKQHPKGVFICNPNNPTGKYLSRQYVETLLEAIGDGLLVLDEAYVAFVDKSWSSVNLISRGNVIILRSMTKDYALAGLRLGYAIANQEIINNLRRVCPPWNVNVVAQKIGAIVLEDVNYLEQSKKKIREVKEFLIDELSRLGLAPLPSDTHYFLVKVGNAREFRAVLLKNRIMVRDCTSFGLPKYIRIAPRTMLECQKLIAAIKVIKNEGGLNVDI